MASGLLKPCDIHTHEAIHEWGAQEAVLLFHSHVCVVCARCVGGGTQACIEARGQLLGVALYCPLVLVLRPL